MGGSCGLPVWNLFAWLVESKFMVNAGYVCSKHPSRNMIYGVGWCLVLFLSNGLSLYMFSEWFNFLYFKKHLHNCIWACLAVLGCHLYVSSTPYLSLQRMNCYKMKFQQLPQVKPRAQTQSPHPPCVVANVPVLADRARKRERARLEEWAVGIEETEESESRGTGEKPVSQHGNSWLTDCGVFSFILFAMRPYIGVNISFTRIACQLIDNNYSK